MSFENVKLAELGELEKTSSIDLRRIKLNQQLECFTDKHYSQIRFPFFHCEESQRPYSCDCCCWRHFCTRTSTKTTCEAAPSDLVK